MAKRKEIEAVEVSQEPKKRKIKTANATVHDGQLQEKIKKKHRKKNEEVQEETADKIIKIKKGIKKGEEIDVAEKKSTSKKNPIKFEKKPTSGKSISKHPGKSFEAKKQFPVLKKHSNEAGDTDEKPDWKKMKAEKKDLKQKRRETACGGDGIFQLGVEAKQIWEEVRREDCSNERKAALSEQLLVLVKGKAKSLIFAHDTVRVIETLVAVGSEDCRSALFQEMKDDVVGLCKNKYSRFFIIKLLQYGTRPQKNEIMAAFKGKVVELMRHKIACDVVELAYNDYANSEQRSFMIQEFFGPHFRLFHDNKIHCVDDALKAYPDKKDYILKDLRSALQPILDKGVYTNTMVHTLLKDYLSVGSAGDRLAVIESLRESLASIVHTLDGARTAMLCLWHGTNKDRKAILKGCKGHLTKIACDEHGYMVLLAAFDCMDDTKFMKKAVLDELMENVGLLIPSDYGLRVLRYLVAPRSHQFFHPDILNVLIQGDGSAASKKDAKVRQRELQEAVSIPLLIHIESNLDHWMASSHWTLFLGAALKTLNSTRLDHIFQRMASKCAEPFVPGAEGHVLESAHMTKMMTYIIKCDRERHELGWPLFSLVLIQTGREEVAGWTVSNRGCFLLVNMLETGIPAIVTALRKALGPDLRKKLSKMPFKGAEILLKKLTAD